MFNKHTYTCPDIIYLRQKAKKNRNIAITSNVVILGALFAYGKYLEHQDNKKQPDLKVVPND